MELKEIIPCNGDFPFNTHGGIWLMRNTANAAVSTRANQNFLEHSTPCYSDVYGHKFWDYIPFAAKYDWNSLKIDSPLSNQNTRIFATNLVPAILLVLKISASSSWDFIRYNQVQLVAYSLNEQNGHDGHRRLPNICTYQGKLNFIRFTNSGG